MEFIPNSPILIGLEKYKQEEILRFHMPGHYGRDSYPELKYLSENLFNFDVTEVEGTDNLNQPTEMILDFLQQVADLYKSKKSYISVNGSTSGIRVAIDTLIPDGGLVVAGRNCHKSVYNILNKKGCEIEYIYPQIDDIFGIDSHIDSDSLFSLIEEIEGNNQAKISAVILTYPNYFGRVYDLKIIANYLASKNIYLIVDEAHGAHFIYSDLLPQSAIELGATISIQSTHKTLPALTQTALIHLGNNFPDNIIPYFEENLAAFQTSSPSYIFMASVEASIEIAKREGKSKFEKISAWLQESKNTLSQLPGVSIFENQDLCKLGISTPFDGEMLSTILRKKHKIQCEMTIGNNILFMVGLTHTERDIQYLTQSLIAAINELSNKYKENLLFLDNRLKKILLPTPKKITNLELLNMKNNSKYSVELKPISESLGLVASSIVTPYPPGIPILVPGDIVSEEIILLLDYLKFSHLTCYIPMENVFTE